MFSPDWDFISEMKVSAMKCKKIGNFIFYKSYNGHRGIGIFWIFPSRPFFSKFNKDWGSILLSFQLFHTSFQVLFRYGKEAKKIIPAYFNFSAR